MKYYIIAGEASGDLHGSNLMKGLKVADPSASFRFWGGDLMSAQGGELVKHYKETAVMGFVEVLGSLGKIAGNLSLCKRDLIEYNPDVVILIDYPGFNFRIARFAKENGLKVFYYIAPKVWAWKEGRVKKLKEYTNRLFIIFPFEIKYFKKHGIDAIYRGNPLLDSINDNPKKEEDISTFQNRTGISQKPIIGLLPGSRMMEIKYLMPRMLKLEKEFPGFQFLLAGAPSIPDEVYNKYLKGSGIKLLKGEAYSIMKHAQVTVLASGTASLEAALLDAPQVVCYGGNEISFQIAKRLVKVKYVSLVNLILDKPLVKELLQHDCTPKKITEEIKHLLGNDTRNKVKQNYQKLRNMLGQQGASVKVAQAMTEELKNIRLSQRFHLTMESPIGQLRLTSDLDHLISVEYAGEQEENTTIAHLPDVLANAKKQLDEYFRKKRERFDIPIRPQGTEFQLKVWATLRDIPYGSVKSYSEIARIIGDKNANRAVGMACKSNPLLIVTPCHRVIGSNNKLTGFNIGLDKKSYLLNHEKEFSNHEGDLFNGINHQNQENEGKDQ